MFIADPPYMGTNIDSYSDQSWTVQDYLKVPLVLDGKNFIYFTSMKSKILEIFEFFSKNKGFQSPFFCGRIEDVRVCLSYVGQYTDVMVSHFLPGCYQEEPLLPQIDERLIYNKIDF